ncbi:hypothetical protein SCBWM1_gp60 [Synechococcus phage S-CBWM1]|uniref:Uncharacterized protein n=1 Tax=Synechococcus phage S-CBWM1 TaxID=2053653 RepID=A0A3G1L3I0_9CAUD|nr:hypothetical protein HOU61_gp137 [Synechococcus phage S-CBWM1]ATW62744.1 hypothetical protein SCBWM1_gp60 [Synechococcus phage S-CBWM1]
MIRAFLMTTLLAAGLVISIKVWISGLIWVFSVIGIEATLLFILGIAAWVALYQLYAPYFRK